MWASNWNVNKWVCQSIDSGFVCSQAVAQKVSSTFSFGGCLALSTMVVTNNYFVVAPWHSCTHCTLHASDFVLWLRGTKVSFTQLTSHPLNGSKLLFCWFYHDDFVWPKMKTSLTCSEKALQTCRTNLHMDVHVYKHDPLISRTCLTFGIFGSSIDIASGITNQIYITWMYLRGLWGTKMTGDFLLPFSDQILREKVALVNVTTGLPEYIQYINLFYDNMFARSKPLTLGICTYHMSFSFYEGLRTKF